MIKNKGTGILSKFMNSQSKPVIDQVIDVNVNDLIPNELNFYPISDVESLANMIDSTRTIEPLIARRNSDGKLVLLSGHRRRAALLYLLEKGSTISPFVKVQVRDSLKDDDSVSEENRLTDEEADYLQLISLNKVRILSPSVLSREMAILKPILQKRFNVAKEKGLVDGKFRKYRAQYWNMSEGGLGRYECIDSFSDELKAYLDDETLPVSTAQFFVNLDDGDALQIIRQLLEHNESLSYAMVRDAVKKFKESGCVEEFSDEPEADAELNYKEVVDNQSEDTGVDVADLKSEDNTADDSADYFPEDVDTDVTDNVYESVTDMSFASTEENKETDDDSEYEFEDIDSDPFHKLVNSFVKDIEFEIITLKNLDDDSEVFDVLMSLKNAIDSFSQKIKSLRGD